MSPNNFFQVRELVPMPHVLSTCHDCPISWNRVCLILFSCDAVLPPLCLVASGCRATEVSNDASFDAVCPADCGGISLRPSSTHSGRIAFARTLPAAAEYPGPKARRGGSRHRAPGQSQAGLSTAYSRGGSRR